MKTKAEAVDEIGRLLNSVAEKFDSDDDHERDYLAERCPPHLASVIRDLPTLAVHLLAAIGDGAKNIVGLAAHSGQLKGTVSKQVQRLVEAGLVARDPVPGNRKEIRLSLTADGDRLYAVHHRMHQEMEQGVHHFFLRYTAAELATVSKVLNDLIETDRDLVATDRRGVGLFTRR